MTAVSRSPNFGVEEIVAGLDRGRRDQRGVGKRPIADVSAVLRLVAVCAVVVPIAKLPDGSGFASRRQLDRIVVPSGSLKVKLICSPGLGWPAARSTENAAGEPEGPVTVAFVNDEVTEFSFKPKGEPASLRLPSSLSSLPAVPPPAR